MMNQRGTPLLQAARRPPPQPSSVANSAQTDFPSSSNSSEAYEDNENTNTSNLEQFYVPQQGGAHHLGKTAQLSWPPKPQQQQQQQQQQQPQAQPQNQQPLRSCFDAFPLPKTKVEGVPSGTPLNELQQSQLQHSQHQHYLFLQQQQQRQQLQHQQQQNQLLQQPKQLHKSQQHIQLNRATQQRQALNQPLPLLGQPSRPSSTVQEAGGRGNQDRLDEGCGRSGAPLDEEEDEDPGCSAPQKGDRSSESEHEENSSAEGDELQAESETFEEQELPPEEEDEDDNRSEADFHIGSLGTEENVNGTFHQQLFSEFSSLQQQNQQQHIQRQIQQQQAQQARQRFLPQPELLSHHLQQFRQPASMSPSIPPSQASQRRLPQQLHQSLPVALPGQPILVPGSLLRPMHLGRTLTGSALSSSIPAPLPAGLASAPNHTDRLHLEASLSAEHAPQPPPYYQNEAVAESAEPSLALAVDHGPARFLDFPLANLAKGASATLSLQVLDSKRGGQVLRISLGTAPSSEEALLRAGDPEAVAAAVSRAVRDSQSDNDEPEPRALPRASNRGGAGPSSSDLKGARGKPATASAGQKRKAAESSATSSAEQARKKAKDSKASDKSSGGKDKKKAGTSDPMVVAGFTIRRDEITNSYFCPFNPSSCSYLTLDKSKIRRHMAIHSDVEAFECPCGLKVKTMGSLRRHQTKFCRLLPENQKGNNSGD